ncbi:MAG: aspartyl/glutamyl-tRNA amidotransferase subunit A [Candidatus Andersenbacteria bacterium RIFCSPHIGHO2_12_FULL_46_9]|nr:MAG: Glutamyl-tRNA(Gln) amidotransferase subunit A [Parcubacteria group bacterium GW2011_GWA2_45_14]OGY35124.1 MAG: aspartyl/glutamyl-tRNA amidotransferase subunit A [Candidatus Andersenbacteria bacterium RIFCSPHIGHO2_02_FULL_46_16]OGY37720.1 MAG: aspartyl/glutamyl-tRNA amidotransferase subunit A [Candidatus Andersenbacteria bacterium RIFCSPHIGHO2_12_FULL_46_9]HBE90052.1 Asp-tRNA(Asn)/Glu-tRNA(Gln) amidotransferase GatCAB subunit A [Candidatus Andersenbacteria bacterium]
MSDPKTIIEAVDAIRSGKISAGELVTASLDRINQWEPHIHAFLELFNDTAVQQAKDIDGADNTTEQPLAGIPISIKDIICTSIGHTTAGSKILQNFRSPYDATVIMRLRRAGAIIIGKTNQDEFAMGASNEFSAYGPAYNPWDTSRVTGGSSGGSAASVASREVFASLGTDTGGSVRQPASFCSVVGLKPTYGRVSRFGIIAYASSLDQVGPFARTVKDCALVFATIAGQDPLDATTTPHPLGRYTEVCGQDITGLKIGLPKEYFSDQVNAQVSATVKTAVKQLEKLGATVKEISLPLTQFAVPTYYVIVKSEASTNLAKYDGLRYGQLAVEATSLLEQYLVGRGKYFGPEVKRSILMGTYTLSSGYIDAWYKQASKVRTLIRNEFAELFKEVDVIAGPVSPETAFPVGQKVDDPLAMYLADMLTDPASVAGLPAISVPCGFASVANATGNNVPIQLPVGLQLIAPHFAEEHLFQVAHAYEQSTDWHKQMPALPA